MNDRHCAAALSATALALATIAMGAPALANEHGDVSRGTCSDTSTYTLKVVQTNKSLVVLAKVATVTAGESWAWTINDNGIGAAAGDSATNRGGQLLIKQTVPNLDGSDTIDFTATSDVTAETCSARLVVG